MKYSFIILLWFGSFLPTFAADMPQSGKQPQDSIKDVAFGENFVLKGITFYEATDSLLPSSYPSLRKLASQLKQKQGKIVRIAGYTDSSVKKDEQVKLSALRARSIQTYLTEKMNIKGEKIFSLGMGAAESGEKGRIEIAFSKKQDALSYGNPFIFENVTFSKMGDTLFASSYPALNRFAMQLKRGGHIEIKIIGHTFTSGSSDYNQHISLNRALAVKNHLVSQGIAPSRIVTEGQGDSNPLVEPSLENSEDKNNRIEVSFRKKEQAGPSQPFGKAYAIKNVVFAEEKAVLPETAHASLDKLAAMLQKNEDKLILLEAFASSGKSVQDARALAMKRAQAVKDYLVQQKGIAAGRIQIGKGGIKPHKDKDNWVDVHFSK